MGKLKSVCANVIMIIGEGKKVEGSGQQLFKELDDSFEIVKEKKFRIRVLLPAPKNVTPKRQRCKNLHRVLIPRPTPPPSNAQFYDFLSAIIFQ